MPQKKYLVDLTDLEKLELEKLLKSGSHQSRKNSYPDSVIG
jgi:hypothetical protein